MYISYSRFENVEFSNPFPEANGPTELSFVADLLCTASQPRHRYHRSRISRGKAYSTDGFPIQVEDCYILHPDNLLVFGQVSTSQINVSS